MKKLTKKTLIIMSAVLVLLLIGIPSSVYGYNSYSYNKSFNEAVRLMKDDKFDEATAKLNKALEYKKGNEKAVKDKLDAISKLKASKQYFEDATKLMGEKKYVEATELYKKITKEDEKRYSEAQKKLEECKTTFISINLTSAKDLAKGNKFEEALKPIEAILAFDKDNAEASALKKDYEAAIEKLKAEAEAKAKAAAEEQAKNTTVPKTPTTPTAPSNGITFTTSKGKLEIKDNGEVITFECNPYTQYGFTGTLFYVLCTSAKGMAYPTVIITNFRIEYYKITGEKVTLNGITTDAMFGGGNRVYAYEGNAGSKYDVYVTYKGKEYKFSGTALNVP